MTGEGCLNSSGLIGTPALNMMLKMGWKPRQTLGKNNNGLIIPISTLSQHPILLNREIIQLLQMRTDSATQVDIQLENLLVTSLFDEEDNMSSENRVVLLRSEIKVIVMGNAVDCLVDTGSDVTCISDAFWNELSCRVKDNIPLLPVKPIQIRGAVGKKSSKIQQVVLLPIVLNEKVVETHFLIVPNLIHSMILGFDWLKLNKAIIQLREPMGIYLNGSEEVIIPFQNLLTSNINVTSLQKPLEMAGSQTNNNNFDNYLQNFKTGISLQTRDFKELKRILEIHKEVFTKSLGRANCYEHTIKMSEHTPFIKRTYPIPYAYRKQMEEKLEEMVNMGIISRSSTPYSSPLTFTHKSDGSLRILLDAREINKFMEADSEAPPIQIDVLNSFHGVNYITIIDLNNAYFQIPLSEESKKYTGFTFNGKSYTYNVLPQGLKTSVGSFSRAMDLILGPEVREFCVNYLDDLAIFTTGDIKKHLEHINTVIGKLKTAGLTCNIEKCKFICTEVKMLGHLITPKGVRTDPEKVDSIQKFPVPKKIKHLRAFLGLCNYYRKFIPDYSIKTLSLCKLLKKTEKWKWTPEAQKAFDDIKKSFINTILLHHPNPTKPYYLQTDSSGVGIAGVLYQYNDNGEMQILGYCSKGLKGPELNWTVTEQEFWAVIFCLRKFETYLRGAKLIIRTDHKALTFVNTWKLYNSRIIRWILYLEQFDYSVEHVKGRDNVVVDVLSRFPPQTAFVQEDKISCPEIYYMEVKRNKELLQNLKNIAKFQADDLEIRQLRALLDGKSTQSNRLMRIVHRCSIKNEVLFVSQDRDATSSSTQITKKVIYLPEKLRDTVILQTHEEMGHQGPFKIKKYLQDRFYWLGMSKDVKTCLKKCHICQLSKNDNIKYVGKCQSIVSNDIGDLIMADLYGPLPKSKYGAAYILVIQDSFSKFVKLYDLRKATSRAVVAKLKHFAKIIKPKVVMTDNGRQFTSNVWRNTLKEMGVKSIYTTVRNPRPNTTERVNRELGRLFRTYCHNNHKGWNLQLNKIEKLYNNTFHESIKFTPNEVVFGTAVSMTYEHCLPTFENSRSSDLSQNRDEIINKVRENLKESSIKRREQYDRSHRLITFQIGDLVKIRKTNKSVAEKKITKKFELLYDGPFVVASVPYANVYTLMDPKTKTIKGNFNAIHLSRYYQ